MDDYISWIIKMKKKAFLTLLAIFTILSLISFAHADDYTLPAISPDFHGTWIPETFVKKFQQTLNYIISYRYESNNGKPHDILMVEENAIWSDLRFHDGYAISTKEFASFILTKTASGPSIIDDNGNSYIRISEAIFPNSHTAFKTYLLHEIQKKINTPTKHPVILIDDNQLRFKTQVPARPPYEVLLDSLYSWWGLGDSRYNIYLYNRNRGETLGLIIGDKSIEVWEIYEVVEMEENYIKDESYGSRLIYRFNRK
jgi:hypothetical protein